MAEGPREKSTISVRAVLMGAGVIAASVVTSLLAAGALLKISGGTPPPPAPGQPFTRAAGPSLETTPQQDLQRFRADEHRKLEGYRLIDEKAGVVHIPIERAMELLAEEHGGGLSERQQP
jgi:hypothetical protein